MDNPAYIVALGLGTIMLLTVCFVYAKLKTLDIGGMTLSGLGIILVGMSAAVKKGSDLLFCFCRVKR